MAKTPETRAQELKDGVTWAVANNWESATSKNRKDIDDASFKTILGLAKRFDAAQTKFEQAVNKKDKAGEVFDKADGEFDKLDKQLEDLYKRVDELGAEADASIHRKSGGKIEDDLSNYEETLKAAQAQTKATKTCFDQITKLNETYDKAIADAAAKVRSQLDGVKSEMTSSNNELNTLEAQIRSAVTNCEGIATKQNKLDAARAVKGFLKVFGGK